MARTSTYLTFNGQAEEAFNFYKKIFQTDFIEGPLRMSEMPETPDMPTLDEDQKNLIMHVTLPILGGYTIMGCDNLEALGHNLVTGTNVSILLEPDTRKETEQLFEALSQGGEVRMPLMDMFWGDYYGETIDKFGIIWALDCSEKEG